MDDLISRKWLMECLYEGWIKFDTEKDTNIYIHLVRDIAPSVEAEPVRHGRWIPVSKRLPDDGRTVLVTDWGETDFGKRYDGRWWDCDGNVFKDVSAWMPLPKPYKGGEQNG